MSSATWDAAVLARVRHLHLRARMLTNALLTGEHRSRRVGQAIEFADYQEYLPGMDLRGLDWRVWGRSDRFVVKRFEMETELPCTVVLDLSGDLETGASTSRSARMLPDLEGSKAGYAITLAATLLYFLHLHGEPVGLELIAGDSPARSERLPQFRSMPARSGRNHLQLLFLQLAMAKPGGVADLAATLARIGARTRRRSWVAVITDGMEEPARWLPALGAFARRGTDLRLFHIYDRREWTMDFDHPALFYSPEGGDELAVDPDGAAAAFREVVQEYVGEVRSGVVRFGGRYLPIRTDLPMESVIRSAVLDEPFGGEVP